MYVVERTHPLAEDLAWNPPRARTLRRLVTGSIWTVAGAGIIAMGVVAPPVTIGLWKLVVLAAMAAGVAGERVGQAVYRRQLDKLTRGEIDLAALRDSGEGEIVRVSGRVRAVETLSGVVHGTPGVYRRLVFQAGGKRWVHEAAVDFELVDDAGQRIFVHAGGARLLVMTEELLDYPAARFGREASPRVAELVAGASTVRARERVLTDGERVTLVGVKTVSPDPDGTGGNFREPPQRPTLKGSRDMPLLILPALPPPA